VMRCSMLLSDALVHDTLEHAVLESIVRTQLMADLFLNNVVIELCNVDRYRLNNNPTTKINRTTYSNNIYKRLNQY
jgi:hypothetical protein